MWNPFAAIKNKIAGKAAAALLETPIDPSAAQAALGGADGLKDLEKKGLLSKFYRHWKDPAFLKQLKTITTRMQADGVNIKDTKAVQAWIKAHEKEVESGQFADSTQNDKPQTYVKTTPDVGRNDPCTCGSGKKYKKCCGAKNA